MPTDQKKACLILPLKTKTLISKPGNLPPRNTTRWVIKRKAQIVEAVKAGLITLEEACKRYNLSVEEFLLWQNALEKNGTPGLRVTHTQNYRRL